MAPVGTCNGRLSFMRQVDCLLQFYLTIGSDAGKHWQGHTVSVIHWVKFFFHFSQLFVNISMGMMCWQLSTQMLWRRCHKMLPSWQHLLLDFGSSFMVYSKYAAYVIWADIGTNPYEPELILGPLHLLYRCWRSISLKAIRVLLLRDDARNRVHGSLFQQGSQLSSSAEME